MQQCVSAHDKCLSKEVLKKELGDKGDDIDDRFLINPEFVQSLDPYWDVHKIEHMVKLWIQNNMNNWVPQIE